MRVILTLFITMMALLFTSSANAANVVSFGAVGDCVSDDTVAFQNAINAGDGLVVIPPTSACYLVTALNVTNRSVDFEGNGPLSKIRINGSAGGIWLDASGSSQITWQNLTIYGVSSVVPSVGILSAATTTTLTDVVFDHVRVDGFFSVAAFYSYGVTSLSCRDSTFIQRQNGRSNSDPSQRTAVWRLDAQNSAGITSPNVTLPNPPQLVWDHRIDHCRFVDEPAGFGGGRQDNNAAFICVTCGAVLNMTGGAIECLCRDDLVLWWFPEGISLHGVSFLSSDGGSATVRNFVQIGGGIAGSISLMDDFFTIPQSGGDFITLSPPFPGRGGGVGNLRVVNPEIGANPNGAHLLSLDGGWCTSASAGAQPWIQNSAIEGPNMTIVACGDVEPSVTLRGISAVILPPGAVNHGNSSWGPP